MVKSIRGFICGQSGSGKSTRAWNMYLKQQPRVLLLDLTGEWHALSDAVVYSARDAVEAIRAFSHKGEWRIAWAMDPYELPAMIHWLIPTPDITRSPVLAMGGMWLLVDEVDLVAPLGPPPEHIRTLYRRSRHAGLSVLSLSQRPENVCREVTALSTHITALQLTEPRAHDYVRKIMGWSAQDTAAWVTWTRRHPHGGCWKDVPTGRLLWLPEAGPPLERGQIPLPLASAHSLPASAPSSPPAVRRASSSDLSPDGASRLLQDVQSSPTSEDDHGAELAGDRRPLRLERRQKPRAI